MIIQFWRLSIPSQGESNVDKNTCEHSNLCSFLLTKLKCCFRTIVPPLHVGHNHHKHATHFSFFQLPQVPVFPSFFLSFHLKSSCTMLCLPEVYSNSSLDDSLSSSSLSPSSSLLSLSSSTSSSLASLSSFVSFSLSLLDEWRVLPPAEPTPSTALLKYVPPRLGRVSDPYRCIDRHIHVSSGVLMSVDIHYDLKIRMWWLYLYSLMSQG